jgi:hypothetical protein
MRRRLARIAVRRKPRGPCPFSPLAGAGFTLRNSKSSWSAVPDPCSASIARRKTGVPSDALWPGPLRGSRARARALTPARGSGSWFPWSLVNGAGPQAGSSHQRPWKQNAASGWRCHPKGRSAAEQPRSGLTTTGRCGRRPEMRDYGSPACEKRGLSRFGSNGPQRALGAEPGNRVGMPASSFSPAMTDARRRVVTPRRSPAGGSAASRPWALPR